MAAAHGSANVNTLLVHLLLIKHILQILAIQLQRLHG
jgi:hypothetical protein